MRSRTVSLGILVLLLGVPTTATASAAGPPTGAVTREGHRIQVEVAEMAGLDRIEVWAWTAGSGATVTPGTPRACVSAQRSQIRLEDRDGTPTEVKVVEKEDGCGTPAIYVFDRVAWRATVIADVPTTVTTEIYERGTAGWHLVEDRREPSTATIDLTWQGTTVETVEPRLEPWLALPNICYTSPPSLCYFGAGADLAVDVTRDALVQGSVSLGGLAASAELSAPGQPAAMRWWLSAWPSAWVTRVP